MPLYTDQTGRTITLDKIPERILSVVPSQTELLYDLGLDTKVIGITKFCVHPEHWFRSKPRVGGTKTLSIQKIRELQPQLVLANKEENVKEQIDDISHDIPVWVSNISNLQDALEMILSVGTITGTATIAEQLARKIELAFAKLQTNPTKQKAAYLVWKDPFMTVGNDTFIHDMLIRSGFENCFGALERYPVITLDDLKNSEPGFLFLSSEPYPFKQKHITELQKELPNTKIMLVDGEMFSWYGSRLLKASGYFMQLQQQIKAEY